MDCSQSAWECELGSHIPALTFDLSSAMPGPDCLVNSYSSARNGSSAVTGSRSLGQILAEEHLRSAEFTIARNRLKINWRELFWKWRDQPKVCACHKLLQLLCHGIAYVNAFSWWQMRINWQWGKPKFRQFSRVLWGKNTQPRVHTGMLKLRCLFTSCKWAPETPNCITHIPAWKEIALLLFQRISEPTMQSFGGGYWAFTGVSSSYTKSEDIVCTVHL